MDGAVACSETQQAGVTVAVEGAVAEGLLQHAGALEEESEVEFVGDTDAAASAPPR